MTVLAPSRLATVTKGIWKQTPDTRPNGVVIDSRGDVASALFVAIKGDRHDGHDHVADAIKRGAVAVVVSRPVSVPSGTGVLHVDDTRIALGRIAAAHRRELVGTRVVAVTGSSGKTTTKRLVDAVLAQGGRGTAAPRSFNNDIGVPLTLLAVQPGDAYVVVEIGTNHPGEIAHLAALARPDVAVITNVGPAHLAAFGDLFEVAREKASILEHVRDGGRSFVNVDRPEIAALVKEREGITTFGLDETADVCLDAYTPGHFTLSGHDFQIRLPGRHNSLNAVAAVLVGRDAGLADDAIGGGLGSVTPSGMRGEALDVGGVTVVNDAYNANPDSVAAALAAFAEVTTHATRRIVILGDMLELGDASPRCHRAVANDIRSLHATAALDQVVLVGTAMAEAGAALTGASFTVTPVPTLDDAALAAIVSGWRPGDAVLIKASRGVGLERLVDARVARVTRREAGAV